MCDSLLHMLPPLNSAVIELNFVNLLSHLNITNDDNIYKSSLSATSRTF